MGGEEVRQRPPFQEEDGQLVRGGGRREEEGPGLAEGGAPRRGVGKEEQASQMLL